LLQGGTELLTEALTRKLKGAERRVAFAADQSSGVVTSELTEALREIKAIIDAVQPENPSADKSDAVLFFDDEEIMRKIGTQILEKQGYRVLTACYGIEALEVYRHSSDSIMCVILDLVMHRMDGMLRSLALSLQPGTERKGSENDLEDLNCRDFSESLSVPVLC
jgi:PleD family two-component response regulator